MSTSFLKKVRTKIEAATVSELQRQAKLMLDKYWRDKKLPLPKFKIVDTPNAKWLGRTIYKSKEPGTSIIELQKGILNDETTLKRVLMHELIHHYDFLKGPQDPKKHNPFHNPHDKFFVDEARRINTRMGKDFVTKVSDRTFLPNATKDQFTVVLFDNKGEIGFAKLDHPDSKQKRIAEDLLKTNRVKVLKTNDGRLLKGPTLNESQHFAIPKDAEMQKYLRGLFQKGQKHL